MNAKMVRMADQVKLEDREEGMRTRQEKVKDELQGKQQQKQVLFSPGSPASFSSSPSHDFSFTISFRPPSTQIPDNSKPHESSFAADLTPADDIFFHGHLLPLQLLSNLPVSPRSSTNSMETFAVPAKEPKKPSPEVKRDMTKVKNVVSDDIWDSRIRGGSESFSYHRERSDMFETSGRGKAKSFSIFGWRKGSEFRAKEDRDKNKRKQGFDVGELLKRYARMVRPLLLFKGSKETTNLHRQAYSFSDSRTWKERKKWRGELSAPASRRTSPGNSGVLLPIPSSSSDSSMEELQAAIQAAIAHCKNSISAEEKITLQS